MQREAGGAANTYKIEEETKMNLIVIDKHDLWSKNKLTLKVCEDAVPNLIVKMEK